jgi:nucleoside-diphosphate-sugar epimerase
VSKVLVTGASGFVGQRLCSVLLSRGFSVRAVVRSDSQLSITDIHEAVALGEIDTQTDWSTEFAHIDCVIHCAARAQVMNEAKADALAAYRAVNVNGTRRLAEQAAEMGVRRFIFLSSIKVNGEGSVSGGFFASSDNACPQDAYGISKWEAEQGLREVAAQRGLEIVIIRPPLVYGSGVKGNFLSILNWLSWGVPLPLGAIQNKRSLVGVDNLADLIVTCINHPAAANQTFLVSDGEDVSTTELLYRLGTALGKPARLLPVPATLIEFAATLAGKQEIAQRLLGNLQVDISMTKETLDWEPRHSVDDGFQKTAQWYLNSR